MRFAIAEMELNLWCKNWLTCASAGAGSNDTASFRQHESRFEVERREASVRDGGAKASDVGGLDDLAAAAGWQRRGVSQHRRHADLVRREVAAACSVHWRRHRHRHRYRYEYRYRHRLHGHSNFTPYKPTVFIDLIVTPFIQNCFHMKHSIL